MVTHFSVAELRQQAGLSQAQGDLSGALVAIRRAVVVTRRKSPDSPEHVDLLRLLADAYADFGAEGRARLLYERVLHLLSGPGADPNVRALTILQYCSLLMRLGDSASVPEWMESLDRLIADTGARLDPHIPPRTNMLRAAWMCPLGEEASWDPSRRSEATRLLEGAFERYHYLKPWPRQAADGMALYALLTRAEEQYDLALERMSSALSICREAFPVSSTHLRVLGLALRLAQEISPSDLPLILKLCGDAFTVAESLRQAPPAGSDAGSLLAPFVRQSLRSSLDLENPQALYFLAELSISPAVRRSPPWAGRGFHRYATVRTNLHAALQNLLRAQAALPTSQTELWEEAFQAVDEAEGELCTLSRSVTSGVGGENEVEIPFERSAGAAVSPLIPARFSIVLNCQRWSQPPWTAALQNDHLDDETALLCYTFTADSAYASLVRPGACHALQLPPWWADSDPARLYESLFGPLEARLEGVSRLIVVPDGPLRRTPLETLPDGVRFLGERFAVSYIPSASMLPLLRTRKQEAAARQTVPAATVSAKVSKETYFQEASRARILTLATRCFLHPTDPRLSRLAFSPAKTGLSGFAQRILKSATDTLEGRSGDTFKKLPVPSALESSLRDDLWAYEIRTADCVADLVLCPSCQPPPDGSGGLAPLLGFAQIFFEAGGTSLIAAEAVPDDHAARFLTALHQELAAGIAKDRALFNVRNRFLAADRDPRHCGAFLLFGVA